MNKVHFTVNNGIDYRDYSFKAKAKADNYSQESIELTWEEIDSIPCITEREVN